MITNNNLLKKELNNAIKDENYILARILNGVVK